MLIFNISPSFQTHAYILGASGSVLAIVAAAATLVPDYTVNLVFIGPVRLKWIALIAVLIDVIGVSAGGNAGGIWRIWVGTDRLSVHPFPPDGAALVRWDHSHV